MPFRLWRRGDAATGAAAGPLGDHTGGADPADEAERAYRAGARFVSVEPTAVLDPGSSDGHTLALLSLVRELTSHGMQVRWRARRTADSPPWWVFGHLYPPATLDGPQGDEALAEWRAKYHVGRCFLRRGPGFVQIRDRRRGFRRLTVTDGGYLAAIDTLSADRGTDAVPGRILSAFESQHLLVRVGGGLWWAPYRLRRWPMPSWEV